ncbi:MAG: DUF2997 domain-containing protein [Verrucomicrobiota bacterium]
MSSSTTARTITVTATEEGEIVVEANGFKGKGCQTATEAIEAALGIVTARKKKAEYSALNTATAAYQTA